MAWSLSQVIVVLCLSVVFVGKDVEELTNELRDLIPEGIDYYFENTGGPIFQAVVNNMNQFGRSASLCYCALTHV